jgi:uncharacterized protein YjbI with pentapeptide repeats
MPHMQIKNRWTGTVLFEGDFETMRLCVEHANLLGTDLSGAYLSGTDLSRTDLSGANLSGANLSRAYLSRTDLSGANLSGAYIRNRITLTASPLRQAMRTDGYEFFLWPTDAGFFIHAGCRWFTFDEAWARWSQPRADGQQSLNDESLDILTMFSLALDRVEDAS